MSAKSDSKASEPSDPLDPLDGSAIFTTPLPHHVSDVDHWGHSDRNYFVFVVLTFLLGFVGMDHMYLRSNSTAFKKLLLNIFGLGIWYIWDIIQVLKDGKLVRKHGLNSPFDWIRGIGRGMFNPLPMDLPKEEAVKMKKGPQWAAPKSYFVFTLLAVFLGIFGADKFYLGQTWQGVFKIFSVFNIFLFLFGLLWVLWDGVHAFFMTESLLEDGITHPLPFKWFLKPTDSEKVKELFKVVEVKEEAKPEGSDGGFFSFFPGWHELYLKLVVPLLQPTVGSAIQNTKKVTGVVGKAVPLVTTALTTAPALLSSITNQALPTPPTVPTASPQVPTASPQVPIGTTVESVVNAAKATSQQRTGQTGGGDVGSSGGPGPILAGALTALLLAGGLKGTYDFFSKQMNNAF